MLRDENLISLWENFFLDHYKTEIENIALSYPEKRSLYVDYWDIDRVNPNLAESLIVNPYHTIYNAEEALKNTEVSTGERLRLHFRVFNLPDINRIGIRKLRSVHLGKLVAMEGLVKKVTEVRPKLQVGAFQCQKCGAVIKLEQEEDIVKEPAECYEDQGGCGRSSSFKLLPSLSEFIDFQKIELQESPEGLRGGAQPERISVYLEDDLVGDIAPGDRVIVNGILHSHQRRRGTYRLTAFDKILSAISIEKQELAFEEVEVTDEDEKEILEVSKDPKIYEKIRESIAPTIYGMEVEKDALTLQLFGGVAKNMPDGTRIRGDIHVLLVGDPGTAKSQILTYISKLAPRSIYASGRASSAAGLTAAAVRDEFGEGHWTLEAGALVLADMGIAAIDEIDKMSDSDRSALHQAMEQQEISVAKAGINATLKSRCALLAAANPKLGRFDEYLPIHEQINMPPALLSRFDLIFSIIDKPNVDRDSDLAAHILMAHKAGEVHEHISKSKKSLHKKSEEEKLMEIVKPVFEPEFLRKYIAYAKRNVFPVMTEEAIETIKNYYVSLRASSEDSIPFTPRQLEAFVRLAEASARVRLSSKVTVEDAQRAISIIDQYLRRVSLDRETGKFDIDIIATGISHTQQERMRTVIDIIKRICEESKDGNAARADVIREAEMAGIEASKAEEILERLKRNGQIYEPVIGKYKITGY
ncbi:AAA family ATPase [Euryarchaeota archaeon ex4484_162]|nr:MAG: minichromosome maintenance protein MCM [Thermoplasmata archaeon]MCD6108198.1 minichromosome maintenance protein MCM [Thermoplasmata archaeon]OYT58587.1 MAG: AAA family ATPase [Euryarchaeota archaeon ex4484_162]RLF62916.1 MAG: AAA family ATPase [Thermoplasmata archaeon]